MAANENIPLGSEAEIEELLQMNAQRVEDLIGVTEPVIDQVTEAAEQFSARLEEIRDQFEAQRQKIHQATERIREAEGNWDTAFENARHELSELREKVGQSQSRIEEVVAHVSEGVEHVVNRSEEVGTRIREKATGAKEGMGHLEQEGQSLVEQVAAQVSRTTEIASVYQASLNAMGASADQGVANFVSELDRFQADTTQKSEELATAFNQVLNQSHDKLAEVDAYADSAAEKSSTRLRAKFLEEAPGHMDSVASEVDNSLGTIKTTASRGAETAEHKSAPVMSKAGEVKHVSGNARDSFA